MNQLLQSVKDEQERINIRLRLRTEIKKLVEWIRIYPLQEEFKPIEENEPGIVKTMNCKYIRKVRIKFRGSRNLRILYLTRFGDSMDI